MGDFKRDVIRCIEGALFCRRRTEVGEVTAPCGRPVCGAAAAEETLPEVRLIVGGHILRHEGEDGTGGDDQGEVPSETLRSVARDALDVDEKDVENALTSPDDPIERMILYDSVVKAIKDSDGVSRSRDYDEMGWRNSALRWTLSERAAHLQANQSLPT